jgi:lysophospholipase L1-like esterase
VYRDWQIFWQHDPMLGWRHRPGQHGPFELNGTRVEVRHNRQGLRDREYPYRRDAGRQRILAVGDSFVWGFGVAQNEIFTEVMESTLRGVEVINAGVSGYSTDQELLWLRDEGMKYRPDLVVLVVAGNDPAMNHRRSARIIYAKPRFVLGAGGELELCNVPVPRASVLRRLAYFGASRSALANTVVGRSAGLARARRVAPSRAAVGRGSAEPFALTAALVGEIRRVAETGDADLLVAATGMYWRRESPGTYQELLAALARRGIDVLDVEAAEGFDGERMRLPDDGHWNGEGHAFVAGRIIEEIERRGLLGGGGDQGSM